MNGMRESIGRDSRLVFSDERSVRVSGEGGRINASLMNGDDDDARVDPTSSAAAYIAYVFTSRGNPCTALWSVRLISLFFIVTKSTEN